ncbi:hypothetical protein ACFS3C_17575 [Azotobacter vinelandii]
MIVHIGDQGFADSVRYFEENVAVALGLDQLPDTQAVAEGKSFEDISDVCGMKLVELALQLCEILPVHQILDQIMVRPLLTTRQVLDQLVPVQQFHNLSETLLQAFLLFLGFNLGHGKLRPPAAEHAKGINQSMHDCTDRFLK